MASNDRQDGRSWKLRDHIFDNKEEGGEEEKEEEAEESGVNWT